MGARSSEECHMVSIPKEVELDLVQLSGLWNAVEAYRHYEVSGEIML